MTITEGAFIVGDLRFICMKEKLIYIAPSLSSFVNSDIAFLKKYFKVQVNTYDWRKKSLVPIYMIHQFFFIVFQLSGIKTIVISFGGYWSLFPALLGKLSGKPVYIILNGTDCAAIPAIGYGNLRKLFLKSACEYSYRMATMLLPVSSSLIYVKNTYFSDDEFSFQGVKAFFPELKVPMKVIPNGCDEKFWKKPRDKNKTTNTFITALRPKQWLGKGGDLIMELSVRFPHCTFYIAGCERPDFVKKDNINLIFLGELTRDQLREHFVNTQFYLQLSIFEGFGCSLCEAMLCECIPIGSAVNAIPEIIGDSGFIVERREINLLQGVVEMALESLHKNGLGECARKRVIQNYSAERREREIISLINETQK